MASFSDVTGVYLAILKGRSVPAQNEETFPLIALAVDDLDAAIERLKAHHVDLLRNVEEDPDSRWVFFRDPGGNLSSWFIGNRRAGQSRCA